MKIALRILPAAVLVIFGASSLFAQEEVKRGPIIVNGDTVEYSADNKEISVSGHAIVIYEGAKLTCEKLVVNSQTKQAHATGLVKLVDNRGVVEANEMHYNFETKTGTIIDANFRANPYFGKVGQMLKVSDRQFVAKRGYVTTCSFDKPHYRLATKKINFFYGEKIQTSDDILYIGAVPVACLPKYNHSLEDPLMHVEVMPGSRKDWGKYMLSAWRYNLSENLNGRVYLDYRNRLGWAEGFGANYNTPNAGKGDLKVYYTKEKPDNLASGATTTEFQRYLIRWRHVWDIDPQSRFVSELYKISDERRKKYDQNSNFLKDYFYREFEKDSEPLSYALYTHAFPNSSLNVLFQKRVNQWFNQTEKLPEVSYTLPDIQIGESPFYYENLTSAASYNIKNTSVNPYTDTTVSRLDFSNKFSMPMRVAFFKLSPFVRNEETLYDKSADDRTAPVRSVFYTGADMSTKFYRLYDVKSNFLGMDINGLRHILTPTVSYNYNPEPTLERSMIKQIDTIDAIARNNSLNFGLYNKLQTKQKGSSVDIANFRIDAPYYFNTKDGDPTDSGFTDFLFDLELKPYKWLRFDGDADYSRPTGAFTQFNYDVSFDFAKERSINFGQRYLRKGGREMLFGTNWRITPKWRFGVYTRYQFNDSADTSQGFKEQQYTISRDLHCWIFDFTYSISETGGHTVYFVFRLKAFPSMEFGFDQSYNSPKSGAAN